MKRGRVIAFLTGINILQHQLERVKLVRPEIADFNGSRHCDASSTRCIAHKCVNWSICRNNQRKHKFVIIQILFHSLPQELCTQFALCCGLVVWYWYWSILSISCRVAHRHWGESKAGGWQWIIRNMVNTSHEYINEWYVITSLYIIIDDAINSIMSCDSRALRQLWSNNVQIAKLLFHKERDVYSSGQWIHDWIWIDSKCALVYGILYIISDLWDSLVTSKPKNPSHRG